MFTLICHISYLKLTIQRFIAVTKTSNIVSEVQSMVNQLYCSGTEAKQNIMAERVTEESCSAHNSREVETETERDSERETERKRDFSFHIFLWDIPD